jgi:hypothetical protein
MSEVGRQSSSIGDVVQRNLAGGALVGAGAYLAGYVLTYLLVIVDGVESGGDIETWKAVGWVFYNAHNVDLTFVGSAGSASITETFTLFEESAGTANLASTVPQFLYFLVPAVALAVGGYVAYQRADTSGFGGAQAAAVGATTLVGYFALVVLGRFLFEASGSFLGADLAIAPDLGTAIVLAGIVYPLVLGAGGAVLAKSQDASRDGERLR